MAESNRRRGRGGLILVAGATGYIGGRLVPQLLGLGERVRCLARDPARLAGHGWPGVEVIAGDILDEGSLAGALQGVHTAYYLVHSMAGGEAGFAERDRLAAGNFAAAARRAGVRHIIYLGGLGSGPLSSHLASRQETGQILRATGLPVTELRAAVIVGAGSASFELVRHLVDRLPVMVCPRWVRTLCQPIAVDDVLRYLVECLDRPALRGRILEIGGADVLTYAEMMLGYAALTGRKRLLVNVPLLTPRLSSYWCDLVTPIPASIARPLIEGLRTEVVVRDPSATSLFGWVPMGYRDAVRRALDPAERRPATVWSSALASVEDRTAPPRSFDPASGTVRERLEVRAAVGPPEIFAVLAGLGGRRGWLYGDWLWGLRGAVDRVAGGVGRRRGRRDPDTLRPGDALDWWRVEEVQPPRQLRLRAEMKMPGRAWLEWQVTPDDDGGSIVTQTAWFEPRGLAGRLYWYALLPVHRVMFRGMLRAVARRAEAPAAGGGVGHLPPGRTTGGAPAPPSP